MHSGSEQPWIKTAVTTSLQTPPPNPDCCATYLKYYDESRDDCASCPGSSVPRLNGHYCETCPVGFEPDGLENEDYGCRPCPVEAYKSVEGMIVVLIANREKPLMAPSAMPSVLRDL